jgi:hypothetical protein
MLPLFDMMKTVGDAEKKMVLCDTPKKVFPLLKVDDIFAKKLAAPTS